MPLLPRYKEQIYNFILPRYNKGTLCITFASLDALKTISLSCKSRKLGESETVYSFVCIAAWRQTIVTDNGTDISALVSEEAHCKKHVELHRGYDLSRSIYLHLFPGTCCDLTLLYIHALQHVSDAPLTSGYRGRFPWRHIAINMTIQVSQMHPLKWNGQTEMNFEMCVVRLMCWLFRITWWI